MSATYSQIVQENKVLYTRNFSVSLRLFQNLKKKSDEKKELHILHTRKKKTKPDQVHFKKVHKEFLKLKNTFTKKFFT